MNISILSKSKIKYVRSLHSSKFRQKYNKYIAEGHKICKEVLAHESKSVEHIICTQDYSAKNQAILQYHRDKILIATEKDMSAISLLKTPSQVLLLSEIKQSDDKVLLKTQSVLLYLDDIQDPGNMGTIIRTADWFGINHIVVSKGCVSIYNPKVIQAAMGSHLNISSYQMSLSELKNTSDATIIGTTLNGEPLSSFTFPDKSIIVMGNEGKGIQEENLSLIDRAITIEGATNKIAESLNVAMATGIICAHIPKS